MVEKVELASANEMLPAVVETGGKAGEQVVNRVAAIKQATELVLAGDTKGALLVMPDLKNVPPITPDEVVAADHFQRILLALIASDRSHDLGRSQSTTPEFESIFRGSSQQPLPPLDPFMPETNRYRDYWGTLRGGPGYNRYRDSGF